MFTRLVGESLARNPRRKILTAAALVVGMAVATATLTVALEVGDRMAREFRSLGANLVVSPQSDSLPLEIGGVDYRPVDEGAYISEANLGKIKTIFWRHNILGFTPFLDVPVTVQVDDPIRIGVLSERSESKDLSSSADFAEQSPNPVIPSEAKPATVADTASARPGPRKEVEGSASAVSSHSPLATSHPLSATLIGTWYEHPVPVPDGSTFSTGAKLTHPWWRIQGSWFHEEAFSSISQSSQPVIPSEVESAQGRRDAVEGSAFSFRPAPTNLHPGLIQASLLGGRSFSSDISARREAPSARGALAASLLAVPVNSTQSTDSPLPLTSHSPLAISHSLVSSDAVVGTTFATAHNIALGQTLMITANGKTVDLHVTGILSTGDAEDRAILVPLAVAQNLSGHPGEFRQLFVSALTKPADTLSERDPKSLTPTEYDRWFCSPYISSISFQIGQVLPGTDVRAIRRVADSEGKILARVSTLLWIVTLAALIAAGLAVAATSATSVLQRRAEIGIMKAIGATNALVGSIFLTEQLLLALAGGAVGFLLGLILARILGASVFGTPAEPRFILLPIILGLAALVAVIGSLIPLRRAAHFDPVPILRGE